MKTNPFLSVSLAAAALLPLSSGAAGAASLVLNNVSAAEAATRLGSNYHIDIVLTANARRHVNVALDDADDMSARLQTINALANALHLDFTKTLVVRRTTGEVSEGGFPDSEVVDSGVSIPFGRTTLPAREAITLIAGVDAAFAHIAGDVNGMVTLSKPTLSVNQAEAEVAKQTGTTWRAVYVLAPRSLMSWAGSPLVVFPNRQREAQERLEEMAAERQAAQEEAAYQAYQRSPAQQQVAPQSGGLPTGATGYGNNGYGNNGYGNNGYGNNGYGDPYGPGPDINTSGNAGGNFPNHTAGSSQ